MSDRERGIGREKMVRGWWERERSWCLARHLGASSGLLICYGIHLKPLSLQGPSGLADWRSNARASPAHF